jgi:hypothetical protein
MKPSLVSTAARVAVCLLLSALGPGAAFASPANALPPPDAALADLFQTECRANASSVYDTSEDFPDEGFPPKEGYPISLPNRCGCPSLSAPWFFVSHSCVLQPGGDTCTGTCMWGQTLTTGRSIIHFTQCGKL